MRRPRPAKPIQANPDAPLYEEIADKVAKLIQTGVMRPGDRIPSLRRASRQHGVSIGTVAQAYITLENRGLIEPRVKSGFFVRYQRQLLEPQPSRPSVAVATVGLGDLLSMVFTAARKPDVVPFGAATPGAELLPADKLRRTLAAMGRRMSPADIGYDMPPGCASLRREIARLSLDWGTALSPDEIITTCGGMEALNLCLRAVTKPGDIVAVESPTYFGILQSIEGLRLKALEVPTHPRTGMELDALEKMLKNHRIAACLAVPNFNNPLGSLMPDEAKQRLVAMLGKREIPLIEDDLNGDLHFGPDRPRVARAWDRNGLVMLCSSFSKTLAPGYRVGWTAPGRFYRQVNNLKFTSTLATATLPQLAVAEFVRDGGYGHHVRSIRRTYSEQVQRASQAIAESFPSGTKITRPAGGFVLWVELPTKVDSLEVHRRALAENISIAPGPMFSARQRFRNFIRISCGHPWSSRMQAGIATLGHVVGKLV